MIIRGPHESVRTLISKVRSYLHVLLFSILQSDSAKRHHHNKCHPIEFRSDLMNVSFLRVITRFGSAYSGQHASHLQLAESGCEGSAWWLPTHRSAASSRSPYAAHSQKRFRDRVNFSPETVLVESQFLPMLTVDMRSQTTLVLSTMFAERALELWIFAALEAHVSSQGSLVAVNVSTAVTRKTNFRRGTGRGR